MISCFIIQIHLNFSLRFHEYDVVIFTKKKTFLIMNPSIFRKAQSLENMSSLKNYNLHRFSYFSSDPTLHRHELGCSRPILQDPSTGLQQNHRLCWFDLPSLRPRCCHLPLRPHEVVADEIHQLPRARNGRQNLLGFRTGYSLS